MMLFTWLRRVLCRRRAVCFAFTLPGSTERNPMTLATPVSITVLNDGRTRIFYQAQNAAGEAVAYPATGQTVSIDPPLAAVAIVNVSASAAGPLAVDIVPMAGAVGVALITLADAGGLPCSPLTVTFAADTKAAQFVFLPNSVEFTPS